MNRTHITILLAVLAGVLAACTGGVTYPDATVSSLSTSELSSEQGSLTIEGTNFYQYPDGEGMRVEVCGVNAVATIVDATTQTIVVPPGRRIIVESGSTLEVALPTEGREAGESDLRIVRPDGTTTVLEDAITCVADASEPDPTPDPEPTPLHASFSADPEGGAVPLTVEFDASGTTGEGDLAYAWNFGDGTTATGVTTTHTFTTTGTYTVTLTVTDEAGDMSMATTTIEVTSGAPTAHYTIDVEPVEPDPETGRTGEYDVIFDGTSSSDPNGDPLTYAWTATAGGAPVGNGPTTGFNADTGITYERTLTVTDPDGNSDSITIHTVFDAYDDFFGGAPLPPEEYGLRLAPQQAEEAPEGALPDLMRVSWYDADDGGVIFEFETAQEHPLLESGEGLCEAELEPRLRTQQAATGMPMAVEIHLETDGDPTNGLDVGPLPGFPRPDAILVLGAPNSDGEFPIITRDGDYDGCEAIGDLYVSATQEGAITRVHLPATVVSDASLLDVGFFILGIGADEDGDLEPVPADTLPDFELL